MQHFNFALKRTDAAAGTFTGYASIFGNRDLGGDVVQPGAFKEIKRNSAGKVLTLWQHNPAQPIGTAEVRQDEKGLHVAGQLVMADPLAQVAREHMRAGTVEGMSIGYDVLPGGAKYLGDERHLTALKLWEVSVVTFGMNPAAHVTAAKSALACTSIAELEDLLREQLVLPKRKARKFANAAWPLVAQDSAEPDVEDLVGRFNDIQRLLKGQ